MQFGIFTVGDVTPDPTTGREPSEGERIASMVALARKAEDVGLDVFSTGEHHNPPFVPSSPTTLLGYIAAQTSRLLLTTSTTLITTNDPVKIAEDYAFLQHLSGGRLDLMLGRGNTGPVYPWFGRDIRDGIALAIENYALLRRLWDKPVVDWSGKFRTPLTGFTSTSTAAPLHLPNCQNRPVDSVHLRSKPGTINADAAITVAVIASEMGSAARGWHHRPAVTGLSR